MNLENVAKPISMGEFSSPVDIVIPFHGQYEKVTRLLESIFQLTRSNPYNIYLVDDNSSNQGYLASLAKVPRVKMVRSEIQRGFGGALRLGFEQGNNPWVIFIHSDCWIDDIGWITSMGTTLMKLRESGVRMVGPKTNNPMSGDPRCKGDKEIRDNKIRDNIILDKFHLPMFCFMCHRDLFNHVGGFIKEYPYGGWEDEEFAHRLRHYGFKQAISGKSWVYHEGEATFKYLFKKDKTIFDKVKLNRQLAIQDMKDLKKLS
jgi:glycosyltransferase involved in cell wall biosynthesis